MYTSTLGLKIEFKTGLFCCHGNVKKVHFFLCCPLARPSYSPPESPLEFWVWRQDTCMGGSTVDRDTHRRSSKSSRPRWPSLSALTL